MLVLFRRLRKYNPSKPQKIKASKETLRAATKLYNNRQKVIKAFKTGIFPYIDGFHAEQLGEEELKELELEESEEESEERKLEKIRKRIRRIIKR